jgi:hypothetical protein
VVNFLDSIPEWAEFVTGHLEKRNELEAKQLGSTTNKKQPLAPIEDDDDSDDNDNGGNSLSNILFKISSIGRQE